MSEKPLKKRKVSKKTKRSWRKFVDISDVDNFLEDQRLEERLGAPFETRKDDELFAVDVSPDVIPLPTRAEKQLRLQQKEPRCYEILKPLSEVPDPVVKRNRVKTREERRHPIAKKRDADRKLNKNLRLKDRVALHNRALAEEKRKNKDKRGEFKQDIWSQDEVLLPELSKEWVTNELVRHTLNNTGKKQKNKPNITKKKPSVLPAIEVPHPGISYNPTYHDHQALLASVLTMEEKHEKDEQHLLRVTSKMFRKVTATDKESEYLNEMSEGLNLVKETNEEPEDNTTETFLNPPVVNKKKTLKTRRKIKEQKQLALELKKKKIEKKKIADVYKLKKHEQDINKTEKKIEKLQALREKIKQRRALEPKNISRIKYSAAEPDYLLSEELSGNLRSAKPSGNILRDRYKSFQQRNIVAPAVLILKRNKLKVKKFVKPEHKIDLVAEKKKYTQ